MTLAGVTLAPDEVEIQATPRPGTAVAHHDGLVVVLDTTLTPALRGRGRCPRAGQRAVQDLRREAGLELDDRIELWVDPLPADVAPHLSTVAADTLAEAGRASRRRMRGAPWSSSTAARSASPFVDGLEAGAEWRRATRTR